MLENGLYHMLQQMQGLDFTKTTCHHQSRKAGFGAISIVEISSKTLIFTKYSSIWFSRKLKRERRKQEGVTLLEKIYWKLMLSLPSSLFYYLPYTRLSWMINSGNQSASLKDKLGIESYLWWIEYGKVPKEWLRSK